MDIRQNSTRQKPTENHYIFYSAIRNDDLTSEDFRYADNIVKLRGCPITIRGYLELNQVNAEANNFYIVACDYLNNCFSVIFPAPGPSVAPPVPKKPMFSYFTE